MLDGGGHRDPSTRIFGGHKLFYDGQWPLAGLYVLSLSLRIGLSAGYIFYFSSTGFVLSKFNRMIKRINLHPTHYVDNTFTKINQRLNQGLMPPISTERIFIYCKVDFHQNFA